MSNADWMQLEPSGAQFYPFKENPGPVNLLDVAWSLARICRYNGHVKPGVFYSVAEHAYWVSVLVEQRAIAQCSEEGLPLATALNWIRWALHHDDTEAFVGDWIRPLKYQPEFAPLRPKEKALRPYIAAAFGLQGEEPAIVDWADKEIIGTEAVELKSPVHPQWADTMPDGKLPAPISWLKGRMGWDFREAAERYLTRHQELFAKHAEETLRSRCWGAIWHAGGGRGRG